MAINQKLSDLLITVDVVIAPRCRGQASMGGHRIGGISRGTPTTPGRHGFWLIVDNFHPFYESQLFIFNNTERHSVVYVSMRSGDSNDGEEISSNVKCPAAAHAYRKVTGVKTSHSPTTCADYETTFFKSTRTLRKCWSGTKWNKIFNSRKEWAYRDRKRLVYSVGRWLRW